MIRSFLVGAVAGGAVMWLWGDRIREAVDEATSGVRTRAAERVQGAAETLHTVADTIDQGLSASPAPRAS